MSTEYRSYAAVTGSGGRILSVIAQDLTEAAHKIERQLSRRGREGPKAQWEHFGQLIRLPDGEVVKLVKPAYKY